MRQIVRRLAVLLGVGLALGSARAQEAFTLAVLPDVQQETDSPRFEQRLRWLVAQREALNLKLVIQVGDLMNFNDDRQYQHQSDGLKVLDEARLPYVLTIGNHDTAAVRVDGGSAAPGNVNQNLRNTAKFNHYWPLARFPLLAGTFEPDKIDNAYHLLEAGGLKWLILNLELWARTEAIEWARTIVAGHPEHNVIVVTHAHLNADSTLQQNNGGYGNNSPQDVFDRLLKPFANIRLVFCGHTGRHGYRTDIGEQGNTIHTFLQCYHDNVHNPTRLLTIDPAAGTLKTWVYQPSADRILEDGSARTLTGLEWVKPAPGPSPGK